MDQLRDAYRNNRLILFVGSGVSANIGLPPWKELIDEIAVQLDYDPEVFNTYGNFLALAEYYRIKKGSIGPLRSWMDREWHRNIEIRDVRLVYAPAGGIGSFGGDVDNWMWPRHTGDFAFYRAYVGKDGKPAPFAEDNVPYQPKQWLRFADEPLREGDFVMVAGYPGRTARYALIANDLKVEYFGIDEGEPKQSSAATVLSKL